MCLSDLARCTSVGAWFVLLIICCECLSCMWAPVSVVERIGYHVYLYLSATKASGPQPVIAPTVFVTVAAVISRIWCGLLVRSKKV